MRSRRMRPLECNFAAGYADASRPCDVVNSMRDAMAEASSVVVIRERYPHFASRLPVAVFSEAGGLSLPNTEWEAGLALYGGKRLAIAARAQHPAVSDV